MRPSSRNRRRQQPPSHRGGGSAASGRAGKGWPRRRGRQQSPAREGARADTEAQVERGGFEIAKRARRPIGETEHHPEGDGQRQHGFAGEWIRIGRPGRNLNLRQRRYERSPAEFGRTATNRWLPKIGKNSTLMAPVGYGCSPMFSLVQSACTYSALTGSRTRGHCGCTYRDAAPAENDRGAALTGARHASGDQPFRRQAAPAGGEAVRGPRYPGERFSAPSAALRGDDLLRRVSPRETDRDRPIRRDRTRQGAGACQGHPRQRAIRRRPNGRAPTCQGAHAAQLHRRSV